jgi:ubiquitin-protein ligase
MRRIASDWAQVRKDFTGHRNITVTPAGGEPPEKYNVTYFVNGIYLLPDGSIETLGRHEVEITLHADYPRYKPLCKIKTPIWHPNFRDGQICIGDIWGAGESLSDIIINIGDMIQYKSWNSYSPLSSEAAQWAIENKHLFPVGTVDLYVADYAAARDEFEIDLFGDTDEAVPDPAAPFPEGQTTASAPNSGAEQYPAAPGQIAANAYGRPAAAPFPEPPAQAAPPERKEENDFEITAVDLAGIEFVPSASRMQTVAHGGLVQGKKINFKVILVKGILWALIGALLGFAISEALDKPTGDVQVLRWMGYEAEAIFWEKYMNYNESWDYEDQMELEDLYNQMTLPDEEFNGVVDAAIRISSGLFVMLLALGLGLCLGIGEGVYYGSLEKTVKYALLGMGISIVVGFVSGYIAQTIYAGLLPAEASVFSAAIVRGLGWSVMGLGVGLSAGLIKPDPRRLLFCSLGGLAGGFIGGFVFNFVVNAVKLSENDTGTFARAIGIIVMGLLIGLGIGLLEQIAKQAWLKVIRGEFEGKEYLVFAGTTSIGNNGKNTIVLFKDRLVAPHHCDIILEGGKYVVVDCGTPLGTVVNGMRTGRHVLRRGDAIAVGNSVLVFNTK